MKTPSISPRLPSLTPPPLFTHNKNRYEGLSVRFFPHVKGTLIAGNGGGGGLRTVKGDKYEGQFENGFAHGLGQLTKANGMVYKGEFRYGKRSGCGVEYNLRPYLRGVKNGQPVDKAWWNAQNQIKKTTKLGTWKHDKFWRRVGNPKYCSLAEVKGVEEEALDVVTQARMFQFKPDGDVAVMKAQDGHGFPVELLQDPLRYPHGTGFLAPGPMGQCFALPDDRTIKNKMAAAANQHKRIWESYNLPYGVPTPDTQLGNKLFIGGELEEMWQQNRKQRWRDWEAPPPEDREEDAGLLSQVKDEAKRQGMMKSRVRFEGRMTARDDDESDEEGGPGGDNGDYQSVPDFMRGQHKDLQLSDEDLVASVVVGDDVEDEDEEEGSSRGTSRGPPPSVFASVNMGVDRAMQSLSHMFHKMAVAAPPRRSLTRPSVYAQRRR